MFTSNNFKLKFKNIKNNINNKKYLEINFMEDIQYIYTEIYKMLLTEIAKS